jgi:16S rRNA (guanine527-N7)-methyltransferase
MDASPDWKALVQGASELGVSLTPTQLEALERYLALLCEWNQRFNLTAIDDPNEILTKHFLDSLSCALVVDFAAQRTLVDVGTGAGFPGLVLKIAYPHLRVTLVDAVQKRLGFLERVAEDLGLRDVVTVHARAEDAAGAPKRLPARKSGGPPVAPPLRERFDVVTARAVARLNVLAEWCVPFARVGGVFVAMKGPDIADEALEAAFALEALGGSKPETTVLTLPGTDIGRSLVRIGKQKPTPAQFPRLPGTAKKAPLQPAPAPKNRIGYPGRGSR